MDSDNKSKLAIETQLVHLGNNPENQYGFVSPPIFRGSTALYEDVQSMQATIKDPLKTTFPNYGRFGSPTARAIEDALCQLEGGFGCVCTGSGLSAITTALLALVKSGDHLLIVDSVYWPTRNFCDSLKKFGIETEYYDPRIGAEIEKLLRPNTRLVFLESPGSMTFEVQDVPAISKICIQKGVKTLIDNTWATPLFFKPLEKGVDISIHSGTKYITGHSDSFIGFIICNQATYSTIRAQSLQLGQCAGAEDLFFALRGLRTLSVRLHHHQEQALELAQWLSERPEVSQVLYPALPKSPDYALWKRDFKGASGLLGLTLHSTFSPETVISMINHLKLFGLGFSWGGYESLVLTGDPSTYRTKSSWKQDGTLIRLHVGVENLQDLKKDLIQAFAQLKDSK